VLAEVEPMAAVIQAKCPGCNTILRIPADWLAQPIRCKHCGMVMHAKPPSRPVSPSSTPAPRTRKPEAIVQEPARPATPSVLFAFEDAEQPRSRRRRRRSDDSWWKGPAIVFTVLVIAGIAAVANWQRIKALLPPDVVAQTSVEVDNKDITKPTPEVAYEVVKPPKETKTPEKKDVPDKPKEKPAPPPEPRAKTPEPKTTPPDTPPTRPAEPKTTPAMPRRALVISIHNYLYANPIHEGLPSGGRTIKNDFLRSLTYGFKIPLTQIAHLSDVARTDARPPMKPVIEQTLSSFVTASRAQDRVLVVFVGHSVEIGDEPYLVPIEGELDNAATLIPLKWVYEQLSKCKARQKVLVLDINRFNPTFGLERPASGPLGAKLDAALKTPPPGVQVWSACSEGQQSYETDNAPMGIFLYKMFSALTTESKDKGLGGSIQKPEDPFPLEKVNDLVNEGMLKELDPLKLTQVARLTGKEAEGGAAYDKAEALPPSPTLAAVPKQPPEVAKLLDSIRTQVSTPPVKVTFDDRASSLDVLPPFSVDKLAKYANDGEAGSKVKRAVRKARAVLWAASASTEPKELTEEVQKERQNLRANLTILKEGYRAPAAGVAESRFKDMVSNDGREVARILLNLTEALDELKTAGEEGREAETKRWQANYDFVLARLEAQVAYVYEYQSMLGQMRKEFPPRDPALHGGWRLASQTDLQGDATGRKLATASRKLLDKLAKDHAGTPWEVLAKREKLTALGLKWQPAR
jgi:hypothetical protein